MAFVQNGILDSLDDLGYDGPFLQEDLFAEALRAGSCSPDFTSLVSWIAGQLKLICDVEESITPTTSAEDMETFELEVSGFLKEMHCPHTSLIEGDLHVRLGSEENRLKLLDFLTTELQAAKMIAINFANVQDAVEKPELGWNESSKCLKNICVDLGLSKPPLNVSDIQLFSKLESQLRTVIAQAPECQLGKPLMKFSLNMKQWEELQGINNSLMLEYQLRRQMLLKRLDVTVQSFCWSDKISGKEDKFAKAYQPKRALLKAQSETSLSNLLAAREDLTMQVKTSDQQVRMNTQTPINKVLMGRVPDRGGRPQEATPPPPEMPAFRKRQEGDRVQGGGRGQRGRGGAGKVQGGWTGGGGQNWDSKWSQGGGGYQGKVSRDGGGYQEFGGGYQRGNEAGYQSGSRDSCQRSSGGGQHRGQSQRGGKGYQGGKGGGKRGGY
ncbi:protein FAM98A-like [Anneissia japonica]|uniref:protein FAM98A-like n=1 Tax=Anneissia japonica TaxID=1529436 RepID=UPI0014257423|nr:protein FAM98A-like [Anneissia japonica]